MSLRRTSVLIVATALLSAASGAALAADKARPVDFTVRSEPTAALPNAGTTMKWDASKGRFGFTVDVRQPSERPSTFNDVKAGAYYRITPSLRIGGSVSLGPQQLAPRSNRALPADQPKVRLETAFKF
jgi:hypothetical protein